MKISIDTKEDSVEEIKKVISMLNSLVANHSSTSSSYVNIFGEDNSSSSSTSLGSSQSSESQPSIFNLFNDSNSSQPTSSTSTYSTSSTPSMPVINSTADLLNSIDESKDEDDSYNNKPSPKIYPY